MYPRYQKERIVDGLTGARTVMVRGPRQSGKSTLVKEICASNNLSYFNLDEADIFTVAKADPTGFIEGVAKAPAAIDEVQRVPELVLAIKIAVDNRPVPGSYLLTGSANYLTLPKVADSLAGRVFLYSLPPLTQREIESRPEDFIEALFNKGPSVPEKIVPGPDSYLERALTGGFPEVVSGRQDQRDSWFESYIATVVSKDLTDISRVHRPFEVESLLRLIAARSSTTLNIAGLARDLRISEPTVKRHLALLETLFLVSRVPVWRGNYGEGVIKAPKIYVSDSGLMASLLRAKAEKVLINPDLSGRLFETFVAMEIQRQTSWSGTDVELFHYRDVNKHEVDLVLERRGGEIVAIEVKASATTSRSDARGIANLKERVGPRFVAGFVIYTGRHYLPLGEDIWALPVASLWE